MPTSKLYSAAVWNHRNRIPRLVTDVMVSIKEATCAVAQSAFVADADGLAIIAFSIQSAGFKGRVPCVF